MSGVEVLVSVDDKHLDRIDEVVKGLKQAGMNIEQQLKGVGVITGSIDSTKVRSLRGVEGVASVEESREIQIAPPGSDIQ